MVLDTIENIGKYASLNPLFEEAIKFIRDNDLSKLPNGVVELNGKDLFVNVTDAEGKDIDKARLETHNKMIDIQIPLNVVETMGYTPRTQLPETTYDEQKDISFYEGKAQQYVPVAPGMFAIFFPQDGHAPCVAQETIHKIIIKVKA